MPRGKAGLDLTTESWHERFKKELECEPLAPLCAAIDNLTGSEREKLSRSLGTALVDAQECSDEPVRVKTVRLLIANQPHGFDFLLTLLTPNDSEYIQEVQFTVFCFLDEAKDLRLPDEQFERILKSVRHYIVHSKSDNVQAVWMAADLLGDHLPIEMTKGILLEALSNAKFPCGRHAALHGLDMMLRRLIDLPDADEVAFAEILSALCDVASEANGSDSQGQIRYAAASVLSDTAKRLYTEFISLRNS